MLFSDKTLALMKAMYLIMNTTNALQNENEGMKTLWQTLEGEREEV